MKKSRAILAYPRKQTFPAAGIAFNLIWIRVAQNRANPESELPEFIGDSTTESVIPAAPHHKPEPAVSTRGLDSFSLSYLNSTSTKFLYRLIP